MTLDGSFDDQELVSIRTKRFVVLHDLLDGANRTGVVFIRNIGVAEIDFLGAVVEEVQMSFLVVASPFDETPVVRECLILCKVHTDVDDRPF
jgi:hypothetical protein